MGGKREGGKCKGGGGRTGRGWESLIHVSSWLCFTFAPLYVSL
jgi:hypothetical protein